MQIITTEIRVQNAGIVGQKICTKKKLYYFNINSMVYLELEIHDLHFIKVY